MVSPIVLALVFGIFEFSLMFRAHLTTSNMAQQGARAAAAYGQEVTSDKMIIDTILEAGAAFDDDEILFIVIFLADGPDDVPGPSCLQGNSNAGAANACNVYTPDQWNNTTLWQDANFGCQPSQALDKWYCPMDRLTRAQPPGYVGVYIKTRYSQATGLFGRTTVLEEQAVVRFEPDPPDTADTPA